LICKFAQGSDYSVLFYQPIKQPTSAVEYKRGFEKSENLFYKSRILPKVERKGAGQGEEINWNEVQFYRSGRLGELL